MKEGIAHGRRPDLVGGGLIRSLGGWSAVKSLRGRKERLLTDERVLGTGDFIERIVSESGERLGNQCISEELIQEAAQLIRETCEEKGVSLKALQTGSRRRTLSRVRDELAYQLVEDFGIPLAETARQLGVSTSAISKAVIRTKEK